jgi:hypothetical protein
MNEYPFFSEYLESEKSLEEFEAKTNLAAYLEGVSLLGISWTDYALNYADEINDMFGLVFSEEEWTIFMAAIANTKLKSRYFSIYDFVSR